MEKTITTKMNVLDASAIDFRRILGIEPESATKLVEIFEEETTLNDYFSKAGAILSKKEQDDLMDSFEFDDLTKQRIYKRDYKLTFGPVDPLIGVTKVRGSGYRPVYKGPDRKGQDNAWYYEQANNGQKSYCTPGKSKERPCLLFKDKKYVFVDENT